MTGPVDIATLEILADWKSDLQTRIARRKLIMELSDAHVDTADLEEEVAHLTKVCRCFKWRGPQNGGDK